MRRDPADPGFVATGRAGDHDAGSAMPGKGPLCRGWFRRRAVRWAGLLVLSLLLGMALEAASLPAALLLGPMVASIAFALGGAGLSVPTSPYQLAQAVVGCLIARTLTLSVISEVASDWPLFAGGVLSVIAASTLLAFVLARMQVLPGSTVIWGSSPGAAGAMTVMSAEFGADMRLVAFMQYTRVIIVASTAALVAHLWVGVDGGPAPSVDWLARPDWTALGATALLIVAGALAGRALRIPAGAMLLPLVFGALLQDLGLMRIELPPLMLAVAYACVGWVIGMRFDRDVVRHATRALPQVIASIFALVAICAGLSWLLVVFAGIDPLSAYLAMSPGGADTVAIIAASTKVDVPFVMAMQTTRFLLIVLIGPVMARMLTRAMDRKQRPDG